MEMHLSVVPLCSKLECRIEAHCQIYILRRINVILTYIVTNHGMVTYIEMNHDMPRYIDVNQDMLRYIEGNQHALRYNETADETQDCLQNGNLVVGFPYFPWKWRFCSPSLLVTMFDPALNQVMAALERLQLENESLRQSLHELQNSTANPTSPVEPHQSWTYQFSILVSPFVSS